MYDVPASPHEKELGIGILGSKGGSAPTCSSALQIRAMIAALLPEQVSVSLLVVY
jgi:hypothetical protein